MRLELYIIYRDNLLSCYFNSIKVRLERRSGVRGEARRNHFNSIKVRLERASGLPDNPGSSFQFHKGAIRTWVHPIHTGVHPHFNSIKVRLERNNSEDNSGNNSDFNSIKVRLERIIFYRARWCCWDFNSIKVRLEHFQPIQIDALYCISIP